MRKRRDTAVKWPLGLLLAIMFCLTGPWGVIHAKATSIAELQQQIAAHQKELSEANQKAERLREKQELIEELIDDLNPGDYVMVHAGAAISKITDDDESETTKLMEELL